MVVIRSLRGGFQLAVGLVQKILGFRGMAFHVPLIGLLGGNNLVVRLVGEALCRGQVGMSRRISVVRRRTLRDGDPEVADSREHFARGEFVKG